MWQDYISLLPTAIAAANGFIALLVGQFFKDRPGAKIALVVSAGILSLCAVGATFYGQSQIIAARVADQKHRHDIRESLGAYIERAGELQSDLANANQSDNELILAYNKWYDDASRFLEDQLGESYVARFNDSSGIMSVVPQLTLSQDNMKLWRFLYVHKIRLAQFSDQFPY